MWNYEGIDKNPTIKQVKAILEYIIDDNKLKNNLHMMISMERPSYQTILIEIGNAGYGNTYEIVFVDDEKIKSFKKIGTWIS